MEKPLIPAKLSREIEILKDMLNIVMKKKEAEEFIYAVDPYQYPIYYEIIKNPMNLMAIHNRLHPYIGIEKPLSDIRLVWENCKKFNHPNSDIWKSADKLSLYFEDLVKSLLGPEYSTGYRQLSPEQSNYNPNAQLETIRTILNNILQKPDAKDFIHPVDRKQYPVYYDIIQNPMDLKTVQNRLHPYKNVDEALSDIRLVWNNCRKFNEPGSDIFIDASHMSEFFEELVFGRLGKAFQIKQSQSIQAEVLPLVSPKIPNSSYWNSAPTLSLININKLAGKPLSTFQARLPQGSKLAKNHMKPLPANSAVALSQMSDVDIHNNKRPRSPDLLAGLVPLAKNRSEFGRTYDRNESLGLQEPLLIPQPEKRGKGRPRKYPATDKISHRLMEQSKNRDFALDSSKQPAKATRKEIELAKKNLTSVSVHSVNKEHYKYCYQLTEAL